MQGLVGPVQNVKFLSHEQEAIAKFQASVCVFWLKNGEQIAKVGMGRSSNCNNPGERL